MKGNDVLIRQVNALSPGRRRTSGTEWQLSRWRGIAIARMGSFEEALSLAASLTAADTGSIYVKAAGGKAQRYDRADEMTTIDGSPLSVE